MNTTLNISLPVSLRKWIEEQVAANGYATTDAFLLEIVRREKALAAREKIDAILEDALQEGAQRPMTKADWSRIRANGLKLAKDRRKK